MFISLLEVMCATCFIAQIWRDVERRPKRKMIVATGPPLFLLVLIIQPLKVLLVPLIYQARAKRGGPKGPRASR